MTTKKSHTTRRNVLRGVGALGVVGATGAGVLAYGQVFDTPYRNWLRATVMNALSGIDLPEDVLASFVIDFEKMSPPSRRTRVLVIGEGRVYDVLQVASMKSDGFERLQRQVVTQFLYSTDFFALEDPTQEAVSYLGLADPRRCFGRNPFAEFLPT